MRKGVKELAFVKMHGIGNDYIYIDATDEKNKSFLNEEILPELSRKISDRHFGIGSDGLILILPSGIADFRMRILNADGSEAQMCGNGIRCVAKYLYEKHLSSKTTLKIETLAGVKEIELNLEDGHVESIKVDMGEFILEPNLIPVRGEKKGKYYKKELEIEDKIFNVIAVGMGNPHCVVFVDKPVDELVNKFGPLIENHKLFPEKANVEFIRIKDKKTIEMRVWERGSQETLACGTGACAAAVASWLTGMTNRVVDVKLRGGNLKIEIDEETNHVFMTGGADFIASGIYYYEL